MGKRKERAFRASRYELPGFSAGMVRTQLLDLLEIIDAHEREQGATPFTKHLREILADSEQHAQDWQRYAAMVTDYRYARETWREEDSAA